MCLVPLASLAKRLPAQSFARIHRGALIRIDRVREVALSTPGIRGIVIDFVAVDFIDSQGSAKVHEILALCEQAGVVRRLARVKPAVGDVLRRDGVLARLGDEGSYLSVTQAVEAHVNASDEGQHPATSPDVDRR